MERPDDSGKEEKMKTEMNMTDGILYVKLSGALDIVTAPGFEEQLESKYAEINGITIDAAELEYISSAGLRVIMTAYLTIKGKGGDRIKMLHVNHEIADILTMTGMEDVVEMVD